MRRSARVSKPVRDIKVSSLPLPLSLSSLLSPLSLSLSLSLSRPLFLPLNTPYTPSLSALPPFPPLFFYCLSSSVLLCSPLSSLRRSSDISPPVIHARELLLCDLVLIGACGAQNKETEIERRLREEEAKQEAESSSEEEEEGDEDDEEADSHVE